MRKKRIKKKIKKAVNVLVGVLGICGLGLVSVEANASWLDNWFDNVMTSSSGIDYFEGQKRGYATFGSFSLRLPARTDYLLSIEKPHLKVGCGGIDLFMGGFSFLNPDYLVQKVQAMLQAAPFIAFDLALQTLCPTCSEILKKAEALIDTLNQIQLSECGIYIPRTVVDAFEDPAAFFKTQAEKNAQSAQQKGFSDLWTKFWNKYVHITGNDVKMEGVSSSDRFSGISTYVRNWVTNAHDSTGYVEYLISQGLVDRDVGEIFRAYIGDIYKTTNNDKTLVNLEYKKPCTEADPSRVFGDSPEIFRLPVGSSSCVSEKVTNIQNKIVNEIIGAYSRVSNKQQLTSYYQSLVKISPVPIHLFVKSAVAMKSPVFLYTIAPDVAKGVIYAGMLDLSAKMNTALDNLSYSVKQNTSGKDTGQEIPTKLIFEVKEKMDVNKKVFDERIISLYRSMVSDVNKSISQAIMLAQFQSLMNAKLGDKYISILSSLNGAMKK